MSKCHIVANKMSRFLFAYIQVTIDFDKTTAQPHENVNVLVTADPSSVVNLLSVDQSVLLMKSGNDITAIEVSF